MNVFNNFAQNIKEVNKIQISLFLVKGEMNINTELY